MRISLVKDLFYMDNAHIRLTLSTKIILICEIKKKLCFT